MTILKTDLLRRAEANLNRDPIVTANTRWYRARLTLVCDADQWDFDIADGWVKPMDNKDSSCHPQIRIRGNSEDCQPILQRLRGGLHRAFRHKLLSLEGYAVATLTLWKTIWRLGEALVAVGKED